jgi:hypothetical protein
MTGTRPTIDGYVADSLYPSSNILDGTSNILDGTSNIIQKVR